jgi:predicted small lipoprotein YifL
MKTSTIVLMLALSSALAGCGQHATGSFLPDIKTYSPEFQKEMKAELPEVRRSAPRTYEFIKDGIKLRDKIRAGKAVQERETGGSVFKRLEQGR